MASEATEWATGIASAQDDDVVIRGYRLSELVGSITLTGGIFLVWQGRLPSQKELEVLDALFVAVLEHGISPSATISRTLASAGVPVQAAIAGGILSIGDVHGGAGEQLAHALSTVAADPAVPTEAAATAVIDRFANAGERVPGYGHPQHPDGDPRALALVRYARQRSVAGRYTDVAVAVEDQLSRRRGRPLPMNVDGATAAILLDLGFSWRMARPLIITARSAGLAAHVAEEGEQGGRWRHIPRSQVTYTGPAPASERPEWGRD